MKRVCQFIDKETGDIVEFSLEINVLEVAKEMASRLRNSKTGKAQVFHGDIKAHIIGRRKANQKC